MILMKDCGGGECALQLLERDVDNLIQREPILRQQVREWCGNGIVPLNEAPVIADKAKEAPRRPNRTRPRPDRYRLDLLGVRRKALGRDDMAQVGHRRHAERTFGPLEAELMLM